MTRMLRALAAAVLAIAATLAVGPPARAAAPENTVLLDLEYGRVVIELLPGVAPNHVARIKKLTREGFYDGLRFHRVLANFMAQTGDPTATGEGGSPYPDLRAEFSRQPFVRGAVGMARTPDPHSANSQFFIMTGTAPWLDGQYTLLGRVIEGIEAVDRLKAGTRASNGLMDNPDIIVKMQIAADATEGGKPQ